LPCGKGTWRRCYGVVVAVSLADGIIVIVGHGVEVAAMLVLVAPAVAVSLVPLNADTAVLVTVIGPHGFGGHGPTVAVSLTIGVVVSPAIAVAVSPIIAPEVAVSLIMAVGHGVAVVLKPPRLPVVSAVAVSPIIAPEVAVSPIIAPAVAVSPIIAPDVAVSPIIAPEVAVSLVIAPEVAVSDVPPLVVVVADVPPVADVADVLPPVVVVADVPPPVVVVAPVDVLVVWAPQALSAPTTRAIKHALRTNAYTISLSFS